MNWKILLAILVSFALMMSASYTMLMPFLPLYIRTDLNAQNEDVAFWSSITYAVTFAISAFVSPLWGKLADRMGKKHMMIRSSVLLTITYFLGGIVQSPFELFLVRAFQGIAAGLWPACLVMLSSYVPKSRLGISIGFMQSANICGGILGPLLGGILALNFGMRNSFFIAGAVLSTISLVTIFYIKEPKKSQKDEKKNDKSALSYLWILKNSRIIPVLLAVLLTQLVLLMVQPIVALYVEHLSKNGENAVFLSGFIISLSGIAGALAAPLWGKFGQRKGFLNAVILAFASAGILMAIQEYPMISLFWFNAVYLRFMLLWHLSKFKLNSGLLTPSEARGVSFGLMFSAQMTGGAIGPVLGGIIVTVFNFSTVYYLNGALFVLIALYLKFMVSSEFKEKADSSAKDLISLKQK